MWRNGFGFHPLLVQVGERYFSDENLKTTQYNGKVVTNQRYAPFEHLDACQKARNVYKLSSTRQDWLYCLINDQSCLVDISTGELAASVPFVGP